MPLGVDIVHIPRISSTVCRFGRRFLDRAFHPAELASFALRLEGSGAPPALRAFLGAQRGAAAVAPRAERAEHPDGAWFSRDRGGRACMAFLASRWAAKEALHKALAVQRFLFYEVEVGARFRGGDGQTSSLINTGPPHFFFDGEAARIMEKLGRASLDPSDVVEGGGDNLSRASGISIDKDGLVGGTAPPPPGCSIHAPVRAFRVELSLSHDGDYAIATVLLR